jgi:hypothetical protein
MVMTRITSFPFTYRGSYGCQKGTPSLIDVSDYPSEDSAKKIVYKDIL